MLLPLPHTPIPLIVMSTALTKLLKALCCCRQSSIFSSFVQVGFKFYQTLWWLGGINTKPVYSQYYAFIYTGHIYIEQIVYENKKVYESLTTIFMQDIKWYFIRKIDIFFRFRMKMHQQTNGRIAEPNYGKYPLKKRGQPYTQVSQNTRSTWLDTGGQRTSMGR